jgi:hypothetical protein
MASEPAVFGPDPVIEAYKRGIDRTLRCENLKLTQEQRLQKLQDFVRLATQLGDARRPAHS